MDRLPSPRSRRVATPCMHGTSGRPRQRGTSWSQQKGWRASSSSSTPAATSSSLISTSSAGPIRSKGGDTEVRLPLGSKIFLGTALVVTAVLGAALLVTNRQAERAADSSALRAVRSTQAAIRDALQSRSQTLLQLAAALVQVPVYVSRIGESIRTDQRADLLDQADELRAQIGADWVLITDPAGVI